MPKRFVTGNVVHSGGEKCVSAFLEHEKIATVCGQSCHVCVVTKLPGSTIQACTCGSRAMYCYEIYRINARDMLRVETGVHIRADWTTSNFLCLCGRLSPQRRWFLRCHGNVWCSPLFFTVDWLGSWILLWRQRPCCVEFHCVEREKPGECGARSRTHEALFSVFSLERRR